MAQPPARAKLSGENEKLREKAKGYLVMMKAGQSAGFADMFKALRETIKATEDALYTIYEFKGFSPIAFFNALMEKYNGIEEMFVLHTTHAIIIFVTRGTNIIKMQRSMSEDGKKMIKEITDTVNLEQRQKGPLTVTLSRWASIFPSLTSQVVRTKAGTLITTVCNAYLLPTWCSVPSFASLIGNGLLPPAIVRVALALCYFYSHYFSMYLKSQNVTINEQEGMTLNVLKASFRNGILTGPAALQELKTTGVIVEGYPTRKWGQFRTKDGRWFRLAGDDNLGHLVDIFRREHLKKYKALAEYLMNQDDWSNLDDSVFNDYKNYDPWPVPNLVHSHGTVREMEGVFPNTIMRRTGEGENNDDDQGGDDKRRRDDVWRSDDFGGGGRGEFDEGRGGGGGYDGYGGGGFDPHGGYPDLMGGGGGGYYAREDDEWAMGGRGGWSAKDQQQYPLNYEQNKTFDNDYDDRDGEKEGEDEEGTDDGEELEANEEDDIERKEEVREEGNRVVIEPKKVSRLSESEGEKKEKGKKKANGKKPKKGTQPPPPMNLSQMPSSGLPNFMPISGGQHMPTAPPTFPQKYNSNPPHGFNLQQQQMHQRMMQQQAQQRDYSSFEGFSKGRGGGQSNVSQRGGRGTGRGGFSNFPTPSPVHAPSVFPPQSHDLRSGGGTNIGFDTLSNGGVAHDNENEMEELQRLQNMQLEEQRRKDAEMNEEKRKEMEAEKLKSASNDTTALAAESGTSLDGDKKGAEKSSAETGATLSSQMENSSITE